MHRVTAALALFTASFALTAPAAWAQAAAAQPPLRIPTDAECKALGAPVTPFAFPAGETLDFDLDAMGAQAGTLTLRVLPKKDGQWPIEVTTQTNTFFSKVRRVKATAMSYLNARTLRPHRYVEDAVENEINRTADVQFATAPREVRLDYKIGKSTGRRMFKYASDALDPVGAIILLRQLPLKENLPLCFDAYGIRTMWRVFGKVVGKEHVSLKVGEFDAWHLAGQAVRVDSPRSPPREIHIWISADERRLPLAAVGAIDLGAVRATLSAYSRPDGVKRGAGSEKLKW